MLRLAGCVSWQLRILHRGAVPVVRVLDRPRSPVDRFWGRYTINSLGWWTARRSERHLQWRFDQFPLFREFAGLWGEHDGETIVDYGCGPGNDLVGFALYTRARRLVGVDISSKALRFAAERLALHRVDPDRVELIQISDAVPRLPLRDGSVDYIQSQGMLHHTAEPEPVLRELLRVLKPGGRGCVMVYHRDSVFFHLVVAWELMIRDDRYPGLNVDEAFQRSTDSAACPISRSYRGPEFVALCRRAGFEAEFIGGYPSRPELDAIERSLPTALEDPRLGSEHRDFLAALEFDAHRYPLHRGVHAGYGGVYRLRKPDGGGQDFGRGWSVTQVTGGEAG